MLASTNDSVTLKFRSVVVAGALRPGRDREEFFSRNIDRLDPNQLPGVARSWDASLEVTT
jgi:hypothetical protein